jgi:sortase A
MRFAGNSLLAVGGSLFGAAAAYQIYRNRAEADLSRLKRGSFSLPTAAAAQVPSAANSSVQPAQSDAATPAGAAASDTSDTAVATPSGEEPAVFAAKQEATPAPGVQPGMLPVKLRIQSIGLNDAKVIEVGTAVEKGVLVWVTADHAVGHHMGTAVPGQTGNCVLSGHISSPVRGQGNIFHSLPSLADKIGSTASVQVADGSWHHYQIVGTNVVTPAETWVTDPTPTPVLTLLTCVPDGVYSHRFLAVGRYLGSG